MRPERTRLHRSMWHGLISSYGISTASDSTKTAPPDQRGVAVARLKRLLLSRSASWSGTIWLYRQLEQHPAIVCSREKETHYLAYLSGDRSSLNLAYRRHRFARARQRAAASGGFLRLAELGWYMDYVWMPRSWSWYARRFGKVAPEQYCADFSNLTSVIDERTWQKLAHSVDDIKIIYLMRDPIERLWLQLKAYYEASDRLGILASMTEFTPDHKLCERDLLGPSLYGDDLKRMLSSIPRDRIHVVLYEQIEADPMGLLRGIEDFLEIPHHQFQPTGLGRRVNISDSLERPGWVREHFYPPIADDLGVLRQIGVKVPDSWCH